MCAFIRSLKIAEGKKLQQILRQSSNRSRVKRAQVILLSEQGRRVQEIAEVTFLHEEYIRELIRLFNFEGMELLKERKRSGRPKGLSEEEEGEIVECAQCPPTALGLPFSHWSLEKLREYLVRTKAVRTLSVTTLQRVLKTRRISLQRTKTWKESNDPEFEKKKKR